MNLAELLELRNDLLKFAEDKRMDGAEERYNQALRNYLTAKWKESNIGIKGFMLTQESISYAVNEVCLYLEKCEIFRQEYVESKRGD